MSSGESPIRPWFRLCRSSFRPEKGLGVLFLAIFLGGWGALADVPLPSRVLDPQSAAEAWNVIRLAKANVDRLIQEDRLKEIPGQISLCSPALRALSKYAPSAETGRGLVEIQQRGAAAINAIAVGGMSNDRPAVQRNFALFLAALDEAARGFDPKLITADISVCPMHPDCLSTDPAAPCPKCGMHLLARRIPYSFIYVRPGEPTLLLEAKSDAPLEAGRRAQVEVRIKTRDGQPVLLPDLMVMHTQPIHLLIVDPSLEDYHHEHPVPTAEPGTYVFSFTPARSGPYRIFADLVPVATSAQEYPFVDLPGATPGSQVVPTANSFTTKAGGLTFEISFPELREGHPQAGKVHEMTIVVLDEHRQAVRTLEPVMNAFAHLVGFYEDYRTVVHLHPAGEEILRQDVRGGPALSFKFFPPRAGFVRLYCQVQIEGKMIFAPFNVNVAP